MWKLPAAAFVLGIGVAIATLSLYQSSVRGQTTVFTAPRTPDGRPDFNGIWQAANTANWDIQDHAARQGPVIALGAAFSVPAGQGVVEGNDIPYQPWAATKKQQNAANWLTLDPEIKCFMPGGPPTTPTTSPRQQPRASTTPRTGCRSTPRSSASCPESPGPPTCRIRSRSPSQPAIS